VERDEVAAFAWCTLAQDQDASARERRERLAPRRSWTRDGAPAGRANQERAGAACA
jgi:hypothetical protein